MRRAEAETGALILAAGIGRRLAGERPKALLDFAGQTLLARHVAILNRAGIADITVVTGFAAEQISAALHALQPLRPVRTLHNGHFTQGSVVSLAAGATVLRAGNPVVLMDADVLYDDRLMARLLGSRHANCLLLDRAIEPGDEPVKLCIAGGRIVDFHKRPTATYEWHGESVGFFRFDAATAADLADRADAYLASGRRGLEYEEPLRDMILVHPERFGFEDISGLPWTEIDFAEDIEKATRLLPALKSGLQ